MGSSRGHQAVSPALQIVAMQRAFPQMRLVNRTRLVWRGDVQPKVEGAVFTLEVHAFWKPSRGPRVWVLAPILAPKPGSSIPPHCFSDRSLCLYHSRENPWEPDDVIAETILPWACEWCFFYEKWLDTGRWLGLEFQHTARKTA